MQRKIKYWGRWYEAEEFQTTDAQNQPTKYWMIGCHIITKDQLDEIKSDETTDSNPKM